MHGFLNLRHSFVNDLYLNKRSIIIKTILPSINSNIVKVGKIKFQRTGSEQNNKILKKNVSNFLKNMCI